MTLLVVLLMMMISFSNIISSVVIEEVEAASGIDVKPVGFDITYTNSADNTKYRLLSSHDPSGTGFNRPLSLFVIDGMLNVSSQIQVTVQNVGNTASGAFTMRLVVIHNEYAGFEILNTTLNVNSIGAGSSTTSSTTWVPRYGGNHTMVATTLIANDDNKGNDGLSRSLAIGQSYDNADAQGSWNLAQGWQLDSAVSLSNSAFGVGSGGTSSVYGANWDRSLTSPVYNFANAHPSPNTYGKLGFFYTGSAGSGDGIRIEWYEASSGNWVNTVNNGFSFDGVVDDDLNDGTSWLIQSEINKAGGSIRPGYIIPTSVLSSQTQFRFRFLSDAINQGQGYWIEDIVMIYEEKAWPEEFQVSMSTGVNGHARRNHWADHVVSITNDGNLTDYYQPSITGLPNDWDYQFVHMSGTTILPSMTLQVEPGETFNYRIQIKPGPNAPVGSQLSTAIISSTLESTSFASVTLNTLVDPEYIPDWDVIPSTHYCLPGNSCEFSINLSNIGDGSDTFAVSAIPVIQWGNWTFDVSYNQPPTVTIAPGANSGVLLQADIPSTALPGQTASIDVTAISQADNSVTDTIRVNLTASMISDAGVGVNPDDIPENGWWVEPLESVIVPFTVWNNATSQDTFSFSLDSTNMRGWNATLPPMTTLVVRSGETGRILVTLTAPESAQSGDPAPLLTPIVTSTTSGATALANPYGGVRVTMLHDLILRPLGTPETITPGENSVASYEVENIGNGPEHAIITVQGIPSTWDYHIEVGATVLTGPISLSPAYDGNHIVQVQVIITPPGGEEANLEIDIVVNVNPSEGVDLNPDDNSDSFAVRTERVTKPVLLLNTTSLDVRTDSLHLIELGVLNDGNYVDGSMRIRIVADTMLPGVTSTLLNGGQNVDLNHWLDLQMPPQQELGLEWLISVASDVPVGSRILFSVVFEGSPDMSGNPQIINHTVVLTITSHRELVFQHTLLDIGELEPSQRTLFYVNATSHSSFTEELELNIIGGDAWSIICKNQEESTYTWSAVIPSTNDPAGRVHSWDCELTAPSVSDVTPLEININSDNSSLWYISHQLSVKELTTEDGGLFLGFGSSDEQLPMMIGAVALLFLIFVVGMVVAINRNRKTISYDDEEEYEEEEERQVIPQQIAQPVVQTMPVAPVQPQPSGFTDEQYRAAGWSEDKIGNLRRQETNEYAEIIAAQEAANKQAQYTAQMHQQQFPAATPIPPTQPIPTSNNVQYQQPAESDKLSSAFGSLGVVAETPVEETSPELPDTASALASLGGQVQSEPEEDTIVEQKEEEGAAADTSNLPQVSCGFCQKNLTLQDQWVECPDCGIYSHSTCRSGQQVCARCGSTN
ncbi:MAG: hypothetical protein HOE69_04195 [Euryarchaeota archaeon]|jgi:uncharacterized membrane protein|nr:hypothetical protein [Euryarchaeota archaeon]